MTRKQRNSASFAKKAVRDNIVESWLCVDCGVNTLPGCPSGPEIRIAFALNGGATLRHDQRSEVYLVKDKLWHAAGMEPWSGVLCIGCLEQRIGRELKPKDFSRQDREIWAPLPCTDRLLDRRGYRRLTVRTDTGEREVIIDKGVAAEIAAVAGPGELPYMEEDAA